MKIGIVGRKCGMSRIFTDEGASVPVTVIEVEPNRVVQMKSEETDGYTSVQVTTGTRRVSRVTKAQAGHYAKAGSEAGRGLWEFRLDAGQESPEEGAALTVDQFEAGENVDVSGVSNGKGFTGVIKRWHWQMQDATHCNPLGHSSPGYFGQRQTPGHAIQGKQRAGHKRPSK